MNDLRILIVEDVKDSADTMAILLAHWGYQATIVQDGERALEVASALLPDVVFLDIGLPGMSGYEVARRLRSLPTLTDVLLVAITGHGRQVDIQRCKEAGIDFHFLKPVEPDVLKRILERDEATLGVREVLVSGSA
jgi:CheY-like chemotaxis protein